MRTKPKLISKLIPGNPNGARIIRSLSVSPHKCIKFPGSETRLRHETGVTECLASRQRRERRRWCSKGAECCTRQAPHKRRPSPPTRITLENYFSTLLCRMTFVETANAQTTNLTDHSNCNGKRNEIKIVPDYCPMFEQEFHSRYKKSLRKLIILQDSVNQIKLLNEISQRAI